MSHVRLPADDGAASALTWRITAPVVALLLLALLSTAYILHTVAYGRDLAAKRISRQIVQSATLVLQTHLAQVVGDYAIWDEAYLNLHATIDRAWAARTMSEATRSFYGVDRITVVGPDDGFTYQYAGGELPDDRPPMATPDPSWRALIEAARAASIDRPTVVGFVRFEDRVQIAAASQISYPDVAEQAPGQFSVLVFARDVNSVLLDELARDYLLSGLRFSPVAEERDFEQVLPLPGFGGDAPLGYLIWSVDLPGAALLNEMVPPVAVSAAVFVLLLLVIVVNARRAGAALDRATAALREWSGVLEIKVRERTAALEKEISDRGRAEEALRAAEARYRSIFENASEGIFQLAGDHRYISANPAMAAMFGFEGPEAFVGRTIDTVLPEAGPRARFLRFLDEVGTVDDFVSEATRQDGRSIWICQNARAVRDPGGQLLYYEGLVMDISERRRVEEQLKHEALHDPLTQLPNRALFRERLDQALERCRLNPRFGFALLFVDCDRFKMINDSLGHIAGDQLLITLGQRIGHCLRRGDLLARLGGDEFAVLVEDGNRQANAAALAERIHEICRRPFAIGGQDVFVNVSIGIANGHTAYADANEILRDADTAMFQAKARGRGKTVMFERGMHLDVLNRLQMETELRHALARNEFFLEYQPIWRLADNVIAGFEALVRWRHPTRGIVAPDQFVSIAEESGLIETLGQWVIENSCRQMTRWRDHFGAAVEDLFLSVNLSPLQLSQPDLVEKIATTLQDTSLPGRALKIEITETAIMANPPNVQRKLTALSALAVRLSIDDFGIGYSSLSQLHTFPFDTLKIDRSFIARMTSGKEYLEIVRTILTLGHSLKLLVVAEGVETRRQRDWLIANGCTYAQGFYFARPLGAEGVNALIRAQRGGPGAALPLRAANG